MKVDESFAAYVVARWSMLYRLAALLAGEPGADELTQTALVRAFLSWQELEEHAATDDLVKGLLAATAASAPPAEMAGELPPGSRSDRRTLWGEVDRLLPRQRAVLVLRHYEMLSDDEIARALGCSLETVTAEGLALETGVDLAELRDELARQAREVDVPLPPVASLLARGHEARRRRTRRGAGWAVAAAVVVVGGLALGNLIQASTSDGPRSARPTPSVAIPRFLSMLPRGEEPRIAYSVRRSLHLGSGRVVALPERPSAIVQTSRWLFVAYLSGEIVRVDTEAGAVATVQDDSRGEVVTDPSGDHVAWLTGGGGPAVVAVQSVDAQGSVLLSDEQAFPARPRCCDNPFLVNGITPDGTVIASMPAASRAWAWTTPDGGTESQVREISGLGNGVISQVTAGGIVVQYSSSHFAIGVLQDDAFLVHDEINAREADFGDPLGHRVVYVDTNGETHVRERAPRGRSRRGTQDVRLQLPAFDEGFSSARWEDDGHVLLDVSDASTSNGVLVRCDVRTGRCETAARFDGPHLVAS
jgi:DNA-directed RNA polymerase specialized sigma24 family protein